MQYAATAPPHLLRNKTVASGQNAAQADGPWRVFRARALGGWVFGFGVVAAPGVWLSDLPIPVPSYISLPRCRASTHATQLPRGAGLFSATRAGHRELAVRLRLRLLVARGPDRAACVA